MSTHKHIDKICAVAIVICLLLCLMLMNADAFGIQAADKVMGYENRLFDTSYVHSIDIVMDDWDSFIASAQSEEYSVCSLVIDGESYANVGIRGKGNTSLSTVESMDSQRYSFKVEFDQYDSTKSYHGLDKLSLNNTIQDASCMKDYLTYRMMDSFGVAAPLCSYVYITVNGEDWGLYLAVEGVEDSFLQRNYGNDYGELYKPDSMSFGAGRGKGMDFSMDDFLDSENESSEGSAAQTIPDGFGFGNAPGDGGMGSSDVRLQYIDDEPDSYSNIFDNAKTDITEADRNRLIASLKTLSSGGGIESVVSTDEVLRYFVVHNFVVNGDSYTGSMVHNYYLYEEDGQLSMIPWDYNLAYGGFSAGDATGSVNDPIDTPQSVSGGDRPMIDWIFASGEYKELYHQYFAEFLESVDFTAIIDEAYTLISPYVEKDPTAFYSLEEFQTGVSTLREFCILRAESVRGQLSGSIPSTDAGQSEDSSALVDASHITLSDMGSMGGGMGGFGGGGRDLGGWSFTAEAPALPYGTGAESGGQEQPAPQMPEGMEPPSGPDVQASSDTGRTFPAAERGGDFGSIPSSAQTGGGSLPLLGISAAVLLLGILIAFKFKRR